MQLAAVPLGIYWLLLVSASGLVALNHLKMEESDSSLKAKANKEKDEDELKWPEFSPIALLGEAMPVLNALLYSWMPAALFAIFIGSVGIVPTRRPSAALVLGLVGNGLRFSHCVNFDGPRKLVVCTGLKIDVAKYDCGPTVLDVLLSSGDCPCRYLSIILQVINNAGRTVGGLFVGPDHHALFHSLLPTTRLVDVAMQRSDDEGRRVKNGNIFEISDLKFQISELVI